MWRSLQIQYAADLENHLAAYRDPDRIEDPVHHLEVGGHARNRGDDAGARSSSKSAARAGGSS